VGVAQFERKNAASSMLSPRMRKLRVGGLNRLALVFVVFVVCTLTACNTVKMVPFTADESIKYVAINPEVVLPAKINYFDLRKSVAIVFSLLAAVAIDQSNQSTMSDLETLSAGNDIGVAQIVHQAFANRWDKRGRLTLSDDATHVLTLEVLDYGLSVPELTTRSLVPTLKVRATLRDEHDGVSWRAEQQLTALNNPIQRRYLGDYFVEPELLRTAWEHAAEIVAAGLISQF
jgi:hypothetical protein